MPLDKRPSLPAPKKADQYKDNVRFKRCDDERLSSKAGYGRTTNTPSKLNKAD